jgi:hypothetical protein
MNLINFKYFLFYFVSIIKSISYSKLKYRINSAFRKTDRSIFILGLGPSLKEDIPFLKPESSLVDYFGVNNFVNSNFFIIFKPKYYLLLDPVYWRNPTNQENIRTRKIFFDSINSKTTWNLTLFFPCTANLNYLRKFVKNPLIKLKLFNSVGIPTVNSPFYYKLMDTQLFAPNGDNVLIHAIYLSMVLGYDPIYLVGADASWHEYLFLNQKSNELSIKMSHFDKTEHTIRYIDDLQTKPANMAWKFEFLYKTFNSFQVVSDYAAYKKIKIYNCSSFSWIDSFERKKVKEINFE